MDNITSKLCPLTKERCTGDCAFYDEENECCSLTDTPESIKKRYYANLRNSEVLEKWSIGDSN